MKRARINLSLENDLLEWLENESRTKRISVSALVRQIVDRAKLREPAAPLYLATPAQPLLNVAEPHAAAAAPTTFPRGTARTKPTRYKLTK